MLRICIRSFYLRKLLTRAEKCFVTLSFVIAMRPKKKSKKKKPKVDLLENLVCEHFLRERTIASRHYHSVIAIRYEKKFSNGSALEYFCLRILLT